MVNHTLKPIYRKGRMTPKRLKHYAEDPTVFVMFNVYPILKSMYEQVSNPKCPSFNECYKVKPLKDLYDQAINSTSRFNIESICVYINNGTYQLFRIKSNLKEDHV